MKKKVFFVIEDMNWAIKNVGNYLMQNLNKDDFNAMELTSKPEKLNNSLVHFGSHYMWANMYKFISKNNKYIISFFHGDLENDKNEKKYFKKILKSLPLISKIIVSNSIMYKRLLERGISSDKIIMIPIGVDTNFFKPANKEERKIARINLNLSQNEIVIGSFQKDGDGWDDGKTPKFIKGPDIFLKVIEKLKKEFDIKVLLTGPARGFVKDGLKSMNVPFVHKYLEQYTDILHYYHALDLYLITSREEGGPMGLLESMAAGIPVVSTNVGMAKDLIQDEVNGYISTSFNPEIISNKVKKVINNKNNNLVKEARNTVKKVDWNIVSKKHENLVYNKYIF